VNFSKFILFSFSKRPSEMPEFGTPRQSLPRDMGRKNKAFKGY